MLDLEIIYKEYAELVFKYLYTLCRNKDIAEELMQETFYQAVRSAHRYDGKCKISTWLCQIAKHLWYQELERKSKKETTELNEEIVSEKIHFANNNKYIYLSIYFALALYKIIYFQSKLVE